MDPLRYINKMIEMYEGPRITAQEPRIGLDGGGRIGFADGPPGYVKTKLEGDSARNKRFGKLLIGDRKGEWFYKRADGERKYFKTEKAMVKYKTDLEEKRIPEMIKRNIAQFPRISDAKKNLIKEKYKNVKLNFKEHKYGVSKNHSLYNKIYYVAEGRKIADIKKEKLVKKVSDYKKEESLKNLKRRLVRQKIIEPGTDLAHRLSLEQVNKLGMVYKPENYGIDPHTLNTKIIRPMEEKLKSYYKQQNQLIKEAKTFKNIPLELSKRIEALNFKITDLVESTGTRLQGIIIDEKTLKPSVYGTGEGLGMGIDSKLNMKNISKADLSLMKTQMVTKVEQGAGWNKAIQSSKAQTMAKALEIAGVTGICKSGKVVKKAEGGRMGFAGVCGVAFAAEDPHGFMKMAKTSEAAQDAFKSGKVIQALKGAKNWARTNLGPAGLIGGELLFMGLGSAYEMTQGKGWKEALDEWTGLGGHFGQAEARLKEVGKELGYSDKEIYNAMKIGQLEDLSTEYEDKLWKLEGIQEKQDIGGTARYKADPSKRFIGERGYVRGKYQDPRSVRQLKAEIPEIAKKGESLYISLADMPTSANIYGEITRAKALEEKEQKSKITDWLTRNKILAEKNWQSQMQMANGGLANLTRTVAPDSGPMSQGLRSLYIDDKDY